MVSLRIRQPTIYFGFLFLSVEGKKSPFKKLGHNFAQNRRKIKEIKKPGDFLVLPEYWMVDSITALKEL